MTSRVASLAFFGKICNFWLFLTLGFFLKKRPNEILHFLDDEIFLSIWQISGHWKVSRHCFWTLPGLIKIMF